MSQDGFSVRERLIRRITARLERAGAPRTQMLVIVILTAAIGLVASASLLSLGFRVIWSRYVLAVAVAYAAFLLLVRLWIALSRDDLRSDLGPEDVADAADLALDVADAASSGGPPAEIGGLDADLEGCMAIVAASLVAAVLLGFAGYFVFTAPAFFAEVLLDGALSFGLYRRVQTLQRRHWLDSAFRHTWLAFAAAAVLLGCLGWAMADYSPGADSIGDVWRTLHER